MSRYSGSLRLALVVVSVAARLAPGSRRDRFVREWTAELHHAAQHRRSPLLRSLASAPHALTLRRVSFAPQALLHDLRYAVRQLVGAPGFSLAAIVTLALGIGANSLIFSVVDSTLMRPLPFADAARIVTLWRQVPSMGLMTSPSYEQIVEWRDKVDGLEAIELLSSEQYILTGGDEAVRLVGAQVSPGLLPFLGVQPALGRTFTAAEARDRAPVVLLQHELWRARFAADPDIIGQDILLDDSPHTVIGVMPEGFRLQSPFSGTRLWLPLVGSNEESRPGMSALAKLRPGSSLEAVNEEIAALAAGAEGLDAEWLGVARRPQDMLGDTTQTAIWSFQGAVALVLLIACANVANLMLARGAARQQEIAIRAALGAGRGRLIRQLIAESLLLAGLGGLLGLALARQGLWLVQFVRPERMRHLDNLRLDPLVALLTLALAACAGLLFALAPALQLRRVGIADALSGGQREGEARGARFARRGLVVAELALSTVLLVGAGLLIGSFVRAQQIDPGFEAEGLLSMRITLAESRYPEAVQRAEFWEALEARLTSSLDGRIESVSISTGLPSQSSVMFGDIELEGVEPPADAAPQQIAAVIQGSSGYADTLRVPLLAGRFFTPDERGAMAGETELPGEQAIVVNEEIARAWGKPSDAIGRGIRFGGEEAPWHRVVGVVGTVKAFGLLSTMGSRQIYQPYSPESVMWLALRTPGDPMQLAEIVREQIRAIDADVPVEEIGPVADLMEESLAEPRFNAWLMGVFATLALLLALVGVYGLLSYTVVQRTREIGIRMAIGASRGRVLRMVGGNSVRLLGIGLSIGILAALWLMRLTESMLFDLEASDPTTYAVVAVVLLVAGLLATWIPARRATRVEPMTALRSD